MPNSRPACLEGEGERLDQRRGADHGDVAERRRRRARRPRPRPRRPPAPRRRRRRGRSAAGRRPRAPSVGGRRSGAATLEHPRRQRHVGRRDPVADGELGPPGRPALGREALEDLVPVGVGPGAGGLGDVADDRHRPVQRAAGEHPQLHRREVLGLVDDDVAVGAHLVVVVGPVAPVLPPPGPRPEQGPGLVEQRDVVAGERDVVRPTRCAGGSRASTSPSVRSVAGGQAEQRLRTEEVVEELRPASAPATCARAPRAHVGSWRRRSRTSAGVDLEAGAGGERLEQARPRRTCGRRCGCGPGGGRRRRCAGSCAAGTRRICDAVADRQVVAQRPAPVADGLGEHVGHADVALDAGRDGRRRSRGSAAAR